MGSVPVWRLFISFALALKCLLNQQMEHRQDDGCPYRCAKAVNLKTVTHNGRGHHQRDGVNHKQEETKRHHRDWQCKDDQKRFNQHV